MWGKLTTVAGANCQGCALLPLPKPSASSIAADTATNSLTPLAAKALGSHWSLWCHSDDAAATLRGPSAASLWALRAQVMCQLRGALALTRAVTQGTCAVAGLDVYQAGSPVFIHTVFELLCSKKNHFPPSPVLYLHTLLAVQICSVLGMPHSYSEWKELSLPCPSPPPPTIPWNRTGNYLSDSPHVLRIVFPPPPQYRSWLSQQACGMVWLFFRKNFSVGSSHS